MYKTPTLLVFFLCSISFCNAQEVISATGRSVENAGYQLSWTVGEPMVETFSSENSALTQGFHQSKLAVTAIDQLSIGNLKLKVYPNPFSEELSIETQTNGLEMEINLVLYDVTGKMLYQKKIMDPLEKILMKQFPSGNYMIRFYSDRMLPLQTFKIVKTE